MPIAFLDTETTGLSPKANINPDRIVEIGLVIKEGRQPVLEKRWLINPQRPIPPEATHIHGISDTDVAMQPTFSEVADDFLDLLKGVTLVIHNASFDISFIEAELEAAGRPIQISAHVNEVIDTLPLVRAVAGRASLDAACDFFGIPRSHRELHGALVDALLLANVYSALQTKQDALDLAVVNQPQQLVTRRTTKPIALVPITPEQAQRHLDWESAALAKGLPITPLEPSQTHLEMGQ